MMNSKETIDPQRLRLVVARKSKEFMSESPHDAHEFFTVFLSHVQAETDPNRPISAAYATEEEPIYVQSYFGSVQKDARMT
jgi:uncharacterized UBP type Zn finger protein